MEEKGGDPTKIRFSTRKVSSVCAYISEDHPSFDFEHLQVSSMKEYKKNATVSLKCPTSTRISAVKFASFGDPVGSCGSYAVGECHDPNSVSVVQKVKLVCSQSYENGVTPVNHRLNDSVLAAGLLEQE